MVSIQVRQKHASGVSDIAGSDALFWGKKIPSPSSGPLCEWVVGQNHTIFESSITTGINIPIFIYSRDPCTSLTHKQVLRVILFGPASLSGAKSSGPTPNGARWGIQEATPGMIAFAAIIVSTPIFLFIEYRSMSVRRFASCCLPMKTSRIRALSLAYLT